MMNEKEVFKILKEQEKWGLTKQVKPDVWGKTKLGKYVFKTLVKPTMDENEILCTAILRKQSEITKLKAQIKNLKRKVKN